MTTAYVLAMHGSPPRDFPPDELAEMFGLQARLHGTPGPGHDALARRHDQIEERMRKWPRTADNDPFWAASHELAEHIERASGGRVVVGFNEFCDPTMERAIDLAVDEGVTRVVVLTPMMTRGGEHSEVDIPKALERAREAHPGVEVVYAWPFEPSEVASFLIAQAGRF